MPAGFENIYDYDPKSAGDLSGKVVLITGGNTGLGLATVKHFAPTNAKVIFTSRSSAKATDAIAEVKKATPGANLSYLQMDLSSLRSVQTAVRSFLESNDRLDILIANAGVMSVPTAVTEDGYEVQFGTNYVGHALLMKLLLPTLARTAEQPGSDVRVVTLTSEAHSNSPTIDYKAVMTPMDSYIPGYSLIRYGQSKRAQLLYARQLAARYPTITSVALHPGIIRTDMLNNSPQGLQMFLGMATRLMGLMYLDPAQGTYTSMWAALGPKSQVKSGGYYTPVGVEGKLDKVCKEGKVEVELWDWTQKELAGWDL